MWGSGGRVVCEEKGNYELYVHVQCISIRIFETGVGAFVCGLQGGCSGGGGES